LDFSKHIQKAEEALRRRNHDFAVELYRQLVDLDPAHGEARAGLRRALRKRAEAKQGGKLLRALSGAVPLSRAKALAKIGKHEACARALEDYLAHNPLDEEANLLLGRSLESAGHAEAARAVYQFVVEIAPKSVEALKSAGALLHQGGDHAGALACYELALEVDPRDQQALKARKDLSADMALSRTSDTRVAHSRELIKDKDRARTLERAGKLHLSEEELRAELERLEARLAVSPLDPELLSDVADVQDRLGDPAAALETLRRALAQRPGSFDLTARAGDLEAKSMKREIARADREGRAAEAQELEAALVAHEVADHRRRVELRPGDNSLRLALARRLMRAGEIDAALAELQRCQNEPRLRGEALFLLGTCFHRKGILDLARKDYERALEGTNDTSERAKEILYNLGLIAESQGRADEARTFFLRIYEIDIGYRDVAKKMETLKS
jgi:tetratricopeptide (TPR) repeat protein